MSIIWNLEFAQAKGGSVLEYCHLFEFEFTGFWFKI